MCEDGDFNKACELIEQALNIDPENAEAYLVALMAEYQCRHEKQLGELATHTMFESKNYQKIMSFGRTDLKELVDSYAANAMGNANKEKQNKINELRDSLSSLGARYPSIDRFNVSRLIKNLNEKLEQEKRIENGLVGEAHNAESRIPKGKMYLKALGYGIAIFVTLFVCFIVVASFVSCGKSIEEIQQSNPVFGTILSGGSEWIILLVIAVLSIIPFAILLIKGGAYSMRLEKLNGNIAVLNDSMLATDRQIVEYSELYRTIIRIEDEIASLKSGICKDEANRRYDSCDLSESTDRPSNWISITSPMAGTLYFAPNPDALSFIQVGSAVLAGQTLCIIEALGLFNEILAENDSVVREICTENAQNVEYGTVLFYIEVTQ
jgi:biotin carboxyl carrier protein